MSAGSDDFLARARRLHQRALVIDTHCDTTQRLADPNWVFTDRHETGHVDLPRLREGGLSAAFFAVWAPGSADAGRGRREARLQIQRLGELVRAHADRLALARTADDVRRAARQARFAVLIAIEGGYLIEDSLGLLREYYNHGATYLTLTHGFHTSWADSSGIHEPLEPRHGGLTSFGRDVIAELNHLGMMIDVSHASDDTVRDVLTTSTAPVIASHSSCRAVAPHVRNLSDELMLAIAAAGGVIQINFAAPFIDPTFPELDPRAVDDWFAAGMPPNTRLTDHVTPLCLLADHVDHAIALVGPEHVGIGSDFDGVPQLPEGMEDCAKLPHLTAELLRRGHTEEALTKVLGENVLRLMDACRRHTESSTPRESNHEPSVHDTTDGQDTDAR